MCLSLETLTFIIRAGLPILVELIELVNSIIIFLSQTTLLGWLTFLLIYLNVILTVLLCQIYLTLVFVLQWFSLHWEILIMLSQFSLMFHHIHNRCPFHCIVYYYSPADWDSLCDHLRDSPCKDIFKLRASAAASEFCEWVQVGIDVYITQWKYLVKPHSSPWYLAACATALVHRNHFLFVPKG